MITLSYGYKKPQNPDTGDVVFPAMELNIQKLNDHTHNGTDSAPLASQTQTISSGSWLAAPVGGGLYRQLVTIPSGLSIDTCSIWFRLSSGETIYPTIERQSTTQYYIYINDSSKSVTAFYR